MTGAWSSMGSIPASHYALVSLPEWQNLLTHFELSDGFAFIVLLVPDADGSEGCRLALQRFLAASDQTLLTIPMLQPSDLKALPSRLLDVEIQPEVGAVWVAAVISERADDYEAWLDAWREGTAKLNQFRNPLREKFAVPLLFVGAPWTQKVLRDMAPDLWSVRTFVVRLELLASAVHGTDASSQVIAAHTPAPNNAGPDPEYALKAAARLRGHPGQETQLANLLHRAGRGFLARLNWEQAEQVLSEAVALRTQFEPESVELAESVHDLAEALRWQYRDEQALAYLEQALHICRHAGSELGEASCLQRLGDIALYRSDHETARLRYEKAMSLFHQVGSVLGKANCIMRLGEIALNRTDHETARLRYEKAMTLFHQIGNLLGEANCVKGLGDIATDRSDHDTARLRYEEALLLFRRVGHVLGEANCIKSLGEIALHLSDHETARLRYKEAMPLFRQVGDALGEANCIRGLGDIALQLADYETAHLRYEEAIPLFRQAGSVLGEANCIRRLGDIALERSDHQSARLRYEDALSLYKRISEPYSIGGTHWRLARLSADESERRLHIKAARTAWLSIGFTDLVQELDNEFGTENGQ